MNALYLAWRSGTRDGGSWGPVGRLEHVEGLFRFYYTQGAKQLVGFQPFPEMDNLEEVYESRDLFPLFANRILSPNRPEYEDYLRWGGFDPDNPPDPIAILGVTEGLRHTDLLEVFPCPTPDTDGCFINRFFLHGVRWMPPATIEGINRLTSGDSLVLVPEPTNPADPNAVAIYVANERIGYVPRYLAADVQQLLHECHPEYIHVNVENVNRAAPLQHRVLCKMRSCWPVGFRPCSGPFFEPIPSEVSPAC